MDRLEIGCVVFLIIAVLAVTIWVVRQPPLSDQVNAICAGHGGVREYSIWGLLICNDGFAH